MRAVAIALCLAATACSGVLEPERDALEAARTRWAQTALESYTFRFQRICFCGGDIIRQIEVGVANGEVIYAFFVDDGEPVGDNPQVTVPTIQSLFDEIQRAIDEEAFEIDATYDPGRGYPVDVWIDFQENAVDEEIRLQVRDFEAVPELDPIAG